MIRGTAPQPCTNQPPDFAGALLGRVFRSFGLPICEAQDSIDANYQGNPVVALLWQSGHWLKNCDHGRGWADVANPSKGGAQGTGSIPILSFTADAIRWVQP